MGILEYRKVIIDVKKDNSHYYFDRMFDEKKEEIKIDFIKINGQDIDISNRREVISYIDELEDKRYFKIVRQLEKGKIYTIEYQTHYPQCMSDLNNGNRTQDTISTRFIELTENATIEYQFPFSIKNYIINIRRKDMTEFNYHNIQKKQYNIDDKKNMVKVTEFNLRNNDKIMMYYSKKK